MGMGSLLENKPKGWDLPGPDLAVSNLTDPGASV
jgi:hypothetical protein